MYIASVSRSVRLGKSSGKKWPSSLCHIRLVVTFGRTDRRNVDDGRAGRAKPLGLARRPRSTSTSSTCRPNTSRNTGCKMRARTTDRQHDCTALLQYYCTRAARAAAVAGCSMVFSEYVSTAAADTATAFSRSVDQGASRNRDAAPYVRIYEVATTIAQNLREAKKYWKTASTRSSWRVTVWIFNMTVKVEDKACELEQQFNSNNNNNSINNSNNSHFRIATAVQTVVDQQKTGISDLDSVVQRLIDKKMGRRKQNAPQRTGWEPEESKNVLHKSSIYAVVVVCLGTYLLFRVKVWWSRSLLIIGIGVDIVAFIVFSYEICKTNIKNQSILVQKWNQECVLILNIKTFKIIAQIFLFTKIRLVWRPIVAIT